METTERIVEAYVRYVLGCATIPNIRCDGQQEIDLLAINPATGERYHIETSISIAAGFSKLTDAPFSQEALKKPVQGPAQRRTFGFFKTCKFGAPTIQERLKQYGFQPGAYRKVIVSWDWTPGAAEQAEEAGIELWSFPKILAKIEKQLKGKTGYLADDTLRTLHLFSLAKQAERKLSPGSE